jgi:hypothetical protein
MEFLVNKAELLKLAIGGHFVMPRQGIDLVKKKEGPTEVRLMRDEVARK